MISAGFREAKQKLEHHSLDAPLSADSEKTHLDYTPAPMDYHAYERELNESLQCLWTYLRDCGFSERAIDILNMNLGRGMDSEKIAQLLGLKSETVQEEITRFNRLMMELGEGTVARIIMGERIPVSDQVHKYLKNLKMPGLPLLPGDPALILSGEKAWLEKARDLEADRLDGGRPRRSGSRRGLRRFAMSIDGPAGNSGPFCVPTASTE